MRYHIPYCIGIWLEIAHHDFSTHIAGFYSAGFISNSGKDIWRSQRKRYDSVNLYVWNERASREISRAPSPTQQTHTVIKWMCVSARSRLYSSVLFICWICIETKCTVLLCSAVADVKAGTPFFFLFFAPIVCSYLLNASNYVLRYLSTK